MDELELARELADIAAEIAMRHFRRMPTSEIKQDGTLVTEADREIERALRNRIAEVFPGHGVLGEERGLTGEKDSPIWIIDPIDGTNNFAAGIPIFATLIALRTGGRTELGIASAPAILERYEGARGDGARMNGLTIRVSETADLAHATVCSGGWRWLDGLGFAGRWAGIARAARRDRAFGDFWGHMLVARGAAEVMIEPALAIWDVAPLEVIVEEAGGKITGFAGDPYPESRMWDAIGNPSCLTTNGLLHEEIVRRLA